MALEKGSKAPDFTLNNQDGKTVRLSDYKGKKVVLYFYPKDSTPKCTEQACNLRDNYERFLSKGMVVIGISADSEKRHKNFIKKYELPFDLLADTEHQVCELYGVWGEKKLYGRTYMGIIRTTFVIDSKGKITEVIEDINAKDHSNQIL